MVSIVLSKKHAGMWMLSIWQACLTAPLAWPWALVESVNKTGQSNSYMSVGYRLLPASVEQCGYIWTLDLT